MKHHRKRTGASVSCQNEYKRSLIPKQYLQNDKHPKLEKSNLTKFIKKKKESQKPYHLQIAKLVKGQE